MAKRKGDGVLQLTDEDYKKIESMAGYGLSLEKIAPLMGRSVRTFRTYRQNDERLELALMAGKAKAHLNVSKTAYDLAVSGKCPQMTMFWLERRGGWKKEDPDIEINNYNVQQGNNEVQQLVSVITDLFQKTREVKEVKPIMLASKADE